jgi:uncharacterized membrane protein YkoI
LPTEDYSSCYVEGKFCGLRVILSASQPPLRFAYYTARLSVDEEEVIVVNAKKMIIGAAVALMLLVGAGVAYANGSSGDGSEQSTGAGMDKAKSIALEQVNGRVTATEFQDEEGYYEVEVTEGDGTQVDVHLDKNYNVLDTPADGGGTDVQNGPNDSNDSNDSGG